MRVEFSVAGAPRLAHGGAQIEDGAFGGPQPQLVASMLLVDRDRTWSPERLAAQLWPSGRPERWRDFSPDGHQLVSTGAGVARMWALDLDDLIGIAESRLTRSLTGTECRQYLHVERCPDHGATG